MLILKSEILLYWGKKEMFFNFLKQFQKVNLFKFITWTNLKVQTR